MDTPRDYILKSVNMLLYEPTQVLYHLADNLSSPPREISEGGPTRFHDESHSNKSFRETETMFSASLGIKGNYGVYSASSDTTYSNKVSTSTSEYNFMYIGKILKSTVSFSANKEKIYPYLSLALVQALENISGLEEAAEFINIYGTHIITGVSAGGIIRASISAMTASYAERTAVSSTVSAAYSGANSISAVATAAYEVAKEFTSSEVRQIISGYGGDPSLGAGIKADEPESFKQWNESCTKDTVFGIQSSIEYADLARSETAKNWLKKYVEYCTLVQTIRNPFVFSAAVECAAGSDTAITCPVPQGYKVISGGAAVTAGSNNFLTGSAPNSTGTQAPTAWKAMAHDLRHNARPGDVLSVYAIAVYDLGNHLTVEAASATGTNQGWGTDKAIASLRDDLVLSGGGMTSVRQSGRHNKLMMCNYPSKEGRRWIAETCDHRDHNASAVLLTAYAMGIFCPDLKISHSVEDSSFKFQPAGSVDAPFQSHVSGGGVRLLDEVNGAERQSNGDNLVQQTYPSYPNTWTVYHRDFGGHRSKVWAYAISLSARIAGAPMPGEK